MWLKAELEVTGLVVKVIGNNEDVRPRAVGPVLPKHLTKLEVLNLFSSGWVELQV